MDGSVRTMRIRGVTLVEMVVATLVVAFLVAATSKLYSVGFQQQRAGRNYSAAQTDGRR